MKLLFFSTLFNPPPRLDRAIYEPYVYVYTQAITAFWNKKKKKKNK